MNAPALNEEFLQGGETRSPFLPGTKIQFAWDSTSLGYIKTCPRLYQYVMLDGWSSREESVHLRFGIEFHQAMQDFDMVLSNGATRQEATNEAVHNLLHRTYGWDPDQSVKAGKYKNRWTIVQLVCDYLDHYVTDNAKTYILESGKPAVELSFRFELQEPYMLSGHLDRVVEFNDELFVMDYKTTTKTLTDYYFNQYEPNNQMTLYTLAGKTILQSPIKGVIVDAAQILLEKPNRFVRSITYRTESQMEEWLDDLQYLFAVAKTYADNDYWPMNDTACDKFGGCRFREVCSKAPQVREQYLKARFDKQEEDERWNPLKPR